MTAPGELAAELDPGRLAGVVVGVWRALLGADDLAPGDAAVADTPSAGRAAARVGARVAIDGAWQASVVLACSPAAADELTRAVAGLPAHRLPDPDDVADALGELVNILGGAVKSLLPGPAVLGLPVTGAPPQGDDTGCPVAVRWRGHLLSLTVQPTRRGTGATAEVQQ